MKMYIWNNPEPPAYSGIIVCAVAETIEEARIIVKEKCRHHGTDDRGGAEEPTGYDIELMEPNAIYDLPCAMMYSWYE